MTKLEILQHIAASHNVMAQGEDAIMMGDTLKNLRLLVQLLQKDVDEETEKDAEAE